MLIMAIVDVVIIILESLFLGYCISFLKDEKAFIDKVKEEYEKAETDNYRRLYKGIIDGNCTPRVIAAMLSSLLSCAVIHITIWEFCMSSQMI